MSRLHVVALPGDGVGPEVTASALQVLRRAGEHGGIDVEIEEALIGGAAIDAVGEPLPAATLQSCRAASAVLLGAVGGPRWDHLRGAQRCEAGLLALRRGLEVFANLRPVRVHPRLAERGVLRPEVVRGTDLIVVRELTGGAYFGQPKQRGGSGATEHAVDTTAYSRAEIERVAQVAFDLARSRRAHLVSVDKANVLITSQLWRDTITAVAAAHPGITVEHQLVDSFAMKLVEAPTSIDVVLTENLFGDILSDEAAVLATSLGMLPSASLGESGPGLYEPVHGSAPGIAGSGRANPVGAILSVAMLLRHSAGEGQLAGAVEAAVDEVIAAGHGTVDIGGSDSTDAVTAAVISALDRQAVIA